MHCVFTKTNAAQKYNLKKHNYFEVFSKLEERFTLRCDFNMKNPRSGPRIITTKGKELLAAANIFDVNKLVQGDQHIGPLIEEKSLIFGFLDSY